VNHILVIDNEENILKAISNALLYLGYDVSVAHDGEKGVELFSKGHNFNLVITDINMPRMNGNEVARYIRRSERLDTPIVAITGLSDDIEEELFNHSLRKPFNLKALVDVVKSLT